MILPPLPNGWKVERYDLGVRATQLGRAIRGADIEWQDEEYGGGIDVDILIDANGDDLIAVLLHLRAKRMKGEA